MNHIYLSSNGEGYAKMANTNDSFNEYIFVQISKGLIKYTRLFNYYLTADGLQDTRVEEGLITDYSFNKELLNRLSLPNLIDLVL